MASSAMWEDIDAFIAKYPDFQLKDELLLDGGRNVMWGCTYSRRQQARDVRRMEENQAQACAGDGPAPERG